MNRRDLIVMLGGAAFVLPLSTQAQQPMPRRLAFVHSGIPADQLTETAGPFWVRRFFKTLGELGDVEGRNLVVERYSAEGHADRFAAIAVLVVRGKPDVIVANFNPLVHALKEATQTIPIVAIIGDPIRSGLVENLGRPGGNLTGVSVDAGVEIYGKELQILKEVIPSATKVAYLGTSGQAEASWVPVPALREAGQRLGIALVSPLDQEVSEPAIRRAFAEMAQQQVDAILVSAEGSTIAHRALIVELAAQSRLPTLYPYRDYVEEGGLMAYAPDLSELAKRMAEDVHQILTGAKAGDIPMTQPTKFELIINLKTAKALGLAIPQSILARADEVIE